MPVRIQKSGHRPFDLMSIDLYAGLRVIAQEIRIHHWLDEEKVTNGYCLNHEQKFGAEKSRCRYIGHYSFVIPHPWESLIRFFLKKATFEEKIILNIFLIYYLLFVKKEKILLSRWVLIVYTFQWGNIDSRF